MTDGVRFGILGPLTVTRDGEAVPVPGRIAPRLLAVLLLEAGRTVTVERLVASVWDGEPPVTARRQVQNTAAALRRRFGADVIASVGKGYRVDLGRCEVDAAEFEAAMTEARERLAHGQKRAAVAASRSGLALWTGEPLTGLVWNGIDAGVRRLVEAKMAAVEDLGELELASGEKVTVAQALREQLRDSPYRQRSAALLMEVLHRDGDTAAALSVFEAVKDRLAEDLGLDPDAALVRVHDAVRGGGSTVLSFVRSGGDQQVAPAAVPAQLLANPTVFTGRDEQLAVLSKHESAGASRACLVSGAAGTGKTALALRWGHEVSRRFPDGQIYLNFRGFDHGEPLPVIEALGRCIRALRPDGPPLPTDVDEAAKVLRTLVDGKRVLFVLDNVRDARQVRALLPEPPSFAVVTSRLRMPELAAGVVALDPLDRDGALRLLAEIVEPERLSAEPDASDAITELCGYLPLALRIAAAHVVADPELPLAEYAEQLRGDRLGSLAIDGDSDAAVAVSIDRSFRVLDDSARVLLCELGTIPGQDFAEGMIAAAVDRPEEELRAVLGRLVDAHLLERHLAGRFRFHDLVRVYARQRAMSALTTERHSAIQMRFIDWHFPQNIDYNDVEDANIFAAVELLRDHPGFWKLISPLIRAINGGDRSDRIHGLIESAIASAERHGDKRGEYQMWSLLASFHNSNEDYDSAIAVGFKAVELARGFDDETLSKAHSNYGMKLQAVGRFREAEQYYLDALRLAPSDIDEARLLNRRMNLCNLYTYLARFAEARALIALVRRGRPTDPGVRFEFRARAQETMILVQLGDHRAAAAVADSAVEVAVKSRSLVYECGARLWRGQLHRSCGRYEAARRDLERALETARTFQRAASEASAISELAILHSQFSRHGTATEYATMLTAPRYATSASPDVPAEISLASAIVDLGIGEHRAAVSHAKRATELNAAMPRPLFLARSLMTSAAANNGLREFGEADRLRRRAEKVFAKIGVQSPGLPAFVVSAARNRLGEQ